MDFLESNILRFTQWITSHIRCRCSLSICLPLAVLIINIAFFYAQNIHYARSLAASIDSPDPVTFDDPDASDYTVQENGYAQDVDNFDEDAQVFEDDMRASEFLRAGPSYKFKEYIGSVPDIKRGVVLVRSRNQGDTDDVLAQAVVLVVTHGGAQNSLGFVMNHKLSEQEASSAREMLRRVESEESGSLKEVIEESVWLGVGGNHRDTDELWIHFHKCVSLYDAEDLGNGVAYGGDVVDVLYDPECRPIKLLYGSMVWSPGELDKETTDGVWIVSTSDADVLSSKVNKSELWNEMSSCQVGKV